MHMGCPFGAGMYLCRVPLRGRHVGTYISLGSTSLNYCPFGAGIYVGRVPMGASMQAHLFRSVPLRDYFSLRAPTGPIMPPSGAYGYPIGHPCGHPYGAPTFKKETCLFGVGHMRYMKIIWATLFARFHFVQVEEGAGGGGHI